MRKKCYYFISKLKYQKKRKRQNRNNVFTFKFDNRSINFNTKNNIFALII